MARTETDILLPAREITISRGHKVVVSPWGLEVGMRLMPRVVAIAMDAVQWRTGVVAGKMPEVTNEGIVKVIIEYQREVVQIIQQTIGYSDEEMEKHIQYEDTFTLAQAVLDICIVREGDDDSPLAKVLMLLGLRGPAKNEPET